MHVITQNCCNDAACVPVCPVNCIHPTPDEPEYVTSEMLYIDPVACIDCGACIEVCPVNAIAPDYELEPRQEPFVQINAQWYRDETHRGYSVKQTKVPRRVLPESPAPLRVAVVGSGPAGCYAVQDLLSQRGLDVQVNVFERLPSPGGLVRYGVAPDHQETKGVADGFLRTLRRPGVSVFLNTEIGRDISHADLMAHHDAVIYAVGAPDSRDLGVEGEGLPGSHAATDFVAWYNGHPDYADRQFDLSSDRAVIIGNGNVALDVARILTSDPSQLQRTDIAEHALNQLRDSRIREVVLVGRRGPAQASFTVAELMGLSTLDDVDIVTRPEELELDEVTTALHADHDEAMSLYKVGLLRRLSDRPADRDRRRIELRFLSSPDRILGDDRVTGVRLTRNVLVMDGGAARSRPSGQTEDVSCGLVLRSVGYLGRSLDGVPFESDRGVVPNRAGRVVDAALDMPVAHVGVYVVGWIKRGPSGVIGTNKTCARETVDALLDDHLNGRLVHPSAGQDELQELLRGRAVIGLPEWKVIDDHERELGRAQSRPRVKVASVQQMLDIAAGSGTTH